MRLKIGETRRIEFTIDYSTYTIAIWQQSRAGGSAELGPVIFQIGANGQALTGFDWVVQAYNFDLQVSDSFFFWIFSGDSKQQGNQTAPNRSSAYITIAKAEALVVSSSSPSSTASSLASTGAPSTSSRSAPGSGSTSPVSTSQTPGTTTPPTSNPEQSSGLSVGAQAGIGVGASLAGIAALAALLLWFRHLKMKQQQALDAARPAEAEGYSPGNHLNKPPSSSIPQQMDEQATRYEAPAYNSPPKEPRQIFELGP
ncbi:hypothetical protein B0T19DRAFT_472153 [Cercophora scortea]|uniref:Uncharacterized protein n=1 Tax=Cercophora scortea TaxID=314031 RepID=A0AAE0J5F2_9PEZI|nr:hypothetical protein B0T19DRAFT_472153 [Cercophora scortea]